MPRALLPPFAAIVVSLGLSAFALFIQGGCSGSAVGVEACRKIEEARCKATTACGATEDEATYCGELYRDQCLYGIENTSVDPSDGITSACVAAIVAVETCARAGEKAMSECTTAAIVAGTNTATTPCQIIERTPELLAACAFLASPVDAGVTTPDTGSTEDAGDAAPE